MGGGFEVWMESRAVLESQAGARTGPASDVKLLCPEFGMVRHDRLR